MAVNYLNNVPKLIGRENYADWAYAVENVFVLEGLSKCIDGTETDTVLVAKAKAKIVLTLDPSLFIHVKDSVTAKEVWDKLKKLYEDSDSFARKIGLLRKLISLRLDSSESMEHYITQVLDTSQKLQRSGFKLSDELIGSLMLAGLTEKYEPMVIAIEHAGIEITADSIKSKLMDMHLGDVDSSSNAGGAFASRVAGFNNGSSRGRQKGGSTHGNRSFSKFVNKNKDEVTCYKCKKVGHYMNRCPERKSSNKTESSNAFNAVFLTGNFDKSEWYIDSGCSVHLTSRKDWIQNVQHAGKLRQITVANDNKLSVECCGDVEIITIADNKDHSVTISEVLYVPKLMTNLLSVSKLIENKNKVVFNENGCDIFNSKDQLIATASLVNNVYKLNFREPQLSLTAGLAVSGDIWHRRFGHLNFKDLKLMKNGLVEGFDCKNHLNKSDYDLCEVCCEGKQSRIPFSKQGHRASEILETIHGDLCGPMEVTSLGGSRYFMILEDDYTRMCFGYFLKNKVEAFETFKEFKSYVENQKGKKIKTFRSDQGTEFNNKQFNSYYKKHGILHQQTNRYTPQQNGMSERMNRTVVEKARCLLYDAKLNKSFWAEAVATAIYLRNRSAASGLEKTPYEMWYNRKPDVSSIRIFGSKAMTMIPKEKRQKWDKKSKRMILIGFSDNIKGYRLYDPEEKKIIISRDVVIEENCSEPHVDNLQEITDSVGAESEEVDQLDSSFSDQLTDSETPESNGDEDFVSNLREIEETTEVRKTQRVPKPKLYEDYVTYGCIEQYSGYDDPVSMNEATSGAEAESWKKAMSEEIQCFNDNKAWELVDSLPTGATLVPSKWVFKKKTSEGGEVRYRARLVAKGYVQKAGIDYGDVFSPVVRHSTLRLLIALAVKLDLKIVHLDVKTAFLNGLLEQPVYMQQPEGFVIKENESKVYLLKKAVYGLKQSSKAWNDRVNKLLSELGYVRSKHESCVFIKKNKSLITLIALYVDDFFVFSNDCKELKFVKSKLSDNFDIKDLGEAKQCLGVRISRDYKSNTIFLDQENYVNQVLKNFCMENCKIANTPMEGKMDYDNLSNNCKSDVNLSSLPYQKLIGSLMYLSVLTRPDITFAVNYLSQFNNNYTEYHWQCAKRLLRYLKGTKNYKLSFSKNNSSSLDLLGFVDSDWANDCDRKSYTGYVFKLSGGPISWQSSKQKTTALSSTEAEYIGLCEASKEAVYLKSFLNELVGFKNSVTINNDNQSAQKLAANPIFHKRSKHIDVRYHFVRECIVKNLINIQYQETSEMVADVLTKSLCTVKHNYFVKKLGVVY